MNRERKITIQDVARRAKVSTGTIDRVIHNRGKVSAEKKRKVEQAIQELNFNPNLIARTLALGKNFRIGILIPHAPSPQHYWSIPARGIETAAAQFKDYGIVTDNFFYNLFDEASFVMQSANLLNSRPDAVVLAPLFLHESKMFVQELQHTGIPYVFIDADLPVEPSLSYIGPEVTRSAFIAGRLLNSVLPVKCEILIVNMVKGFANASALHRIEAGFRSYFLKNGMGFQKTIHTLSINSTQKEDVFPELERFYKSHEAIKGAFVTNSQAFLVSEFHGIHKLDIRLLGYDLVEQNIACLKEGGIDFIISQSPFQQGERAIQTLFDYFVYRKEPERIQYVPIDIIIRENLDFYIRFNQRLPHIMKQED